MLLSLRPYQTEALVRVRDLACPCLTALTVEAEARDSPIRSNR
jgi:hypothetical protein